MYYKKLIDDLLQELSYRSKEGYPILSKKEHQSIISEILTEWGDFGAKEIIMEFLTEGPKIKEADETDQSYTHIGAGIYVRSGDVGPDGKAKPGAQKYQQDESGRFSPVSEDDYETMKANQGAEGEDAAAVQNAQTAAQAGGEEAGAEGDAGQATQEPQPGSSLQSSEYQQLVKREKEVQTQMSAEKSNGIENTNQEEILNSFSTEKDDILKGEKSPPGTGGSAIGEMYGGVAMKEFNDTNITENDFINKHFEDVRNSSISDGMTDKDVKSWLKVSYRTGVSEVNELKTNSKYRYKNPQTNPFPIPVMDPVNTQGSARKKLVEFFEQKIKEAEANGDKKALKHYKRQLHFIEKREDTDTGILYETNEGYVGFKHTSNKKSYSDPVFNTTVNQRGEVMKASVESVSKEYDLNEQETKKIESSIDTVVQTAVKSIQEASQGPSGALQSNVSDTAEFASKHKIGKQFMNFDAGQGGRKNYLDEIRKELKSNKGLGKKVNKILQDKGIQQPYSDDDIAGAVLELSKKGDTTSGVTKMVVKLSDNVKLARAVHERIRKKYPNLSEDELRQKTLEVLNGYKSKNSVPFDSESLDSLLSPELDWIEKVGSGTRDAMGAAHKQIVTDLTNADEQWQRENAPRDPQPPVNGPHKQAYVNSFMKQMHWDRYILGEEEDIGDMNISGKTINSGMIRGCLAKLSGYEGDLNSKEGKEALMSHLRKTMQISSESQSLTFSSGNTDKPVEIGKEQYRTKGTGNNSLLGNFGKDLQDCLKQS